MAANKNTVNEQVLTPLEMLRAKSIEKNLLKKAKLPTELPKINIVMDENETYPEIPRAPAHTAKLAESLGGISFIPSGKETREVKDKVKEEVVATLNTKQQNIEEVKKTPVTPLTSKKYIDRIGGLTRYFRGSKGNLKMIAGKDFEKYLHEHKHN